VTGQDMFYGYKVNIICQVWLLYTIKYE
jgi:hypothetical protein